MQHLLFDVAEHFTQGTPESTNSDGKQKSRLDYVFRHAAALRAVRRFEVSQEQVVPKHRLLVVEIDVEMYTATQVVMVRQVKLDAPDKNKTGNFWKELGGKGRNDTLWKGVTYCLPETAGREDRREEDGGKREGDQGSWAKSTCTSGRGRI